MRQDGLGLGRSQIWLAYLSAGFYTPPPLSRIAATRCQRLRRAENVRSSFRRFIRNLSIDLRPSLT